MTLSRLTLLASLILAATAAQAQTPAAKPAARPAVKRAAHTPIKRAAPAAKPVDLPAADAQQLQAFDRAYLGDYACELKQSVHLGAVEGKPGYVMVDWNKQHFTMKPVLSSTGALRLEDVAGRALLIQIANKSMLLDTKIGQRLVDNCVTGAQIKAMAAAKAEAEADPEGAARNALGIVKQ